MDGTESAVAETKSDVVDEVVSHEPEASTTDATSVENVSKSRESDKEINWKKMRQQMEELQWENKKLREEYEKTRQPQKVEEEDDVEKLAADELLTKAQTTKLSRKEAKKIVQETITQYMKQRDLDTLDDRVKMRYPDYNSLVTEENLEELKRDPLFVKSLKGLGDPFDQACFVYEQLKLRGVSKEEFMQKKQIEQNAAKPRSVQSLGGTSPLHKAQDFSAWPNKDIQDKLYKEMIEAMKGA